MAWANATDFLKVYVDSPCFFSSCNPICVSLFPIITAYVKSCSNSHPSHAGDQLEFAHLSGQPNDWTDANFNNCPDGRGTCGSVVNYRYPYFHVGPVVVHVSKVPEGGDIHTYDGAGEWVKM
jgi:hypothetical protein